MPGPGSSSGRALGMDLQVVQLRFNWVKIFLPLVQRASSTEVWCFLWYTSEQTARSPLVWDAMAIMWCHCDEGTENMAPKDPYSTHKFFAVYDDVIKWKHFPRYWPFVREIHRSLVNSPHKGQWLGALMLFFICAWINGWVNNREAGDLRRHCAHCDVTVMNWPVTNNGQRHTRIVPTEIGQHDSY